MRFLFLISGLMLTVSPVWGQLLTVNGTPTLVHPGLVSSEHTDVKLTFSPDGKRMLWGVVGRTDGMGGWDIWESTLENGRWSIPAAVTFNSDSNDFDPCFAPDGSGVYFFSNRRGGLGGDDLYFAYFDPHTGAYGYAVNLGENVNSAGDEWGPVLSADGKTLLFCTDGHGGLGKHDLFISPHKKGRWQKAVHLGHAINSTGDDFDAVWLDDGKTLVLASERDMPGQVDLYLSVKGKQGYTTPIKCVALSTAGWDFGCSVDYNQPGVLYFTAQNPDDSVGKMDIYRVLYRLTP